MGILHTLRDSNGRAMYTLETPDEDDLALWVLTDLEDGARLYIKDSDMVSVSAFLADTFKLYDL